MDTWLKKAYDNWSQVLEYDGKSLLNFMQTEKPNTSKIELPLGSADYSLSLDNQLPPQKLLATVPSESTSIDHSVMVGGEHQLIENCLNLCEPFCYTINPLQ